MSNNDSQRKIVRSEAVIKRQQNELRNEKKNRNRRVGERTQTQIIEDLQRKNVKLKAVIEHQKEELEKEKKNRNRIGVLKTQLKDKRRYEMVLSMRSRIEFLEEFLEVPTVDIRNGKHIICRDERWLTWFDTRSEDLFVKKFITRIEAEGSNIEIFCKSLSVLYGDFSDRAAHRIPLPEEITEGDIDALLKLIGVFKDKPVRAAVKILITPLEEEETNHSSSSDDVTFSNQ